VLLSPTPPLLHHGKRFGFATIIPQSHPSETIPYLALLSHVNLCRTKLPAFDVGKSTPGWNLYSGGERTSLHSFRGQERPVQKVKGTCVVLCR
jgi:hypothetical protein